MLSGTAEIRLLGMRCAHHFGSDYYLHVLGCHQAEPPPLLGSSGHRHPGAANAQSCTTLAGNDPGHKLRFFVPLYRASCAQHPTLRVAVSALWLGAVRCEGLEMQGVWLRLEYLR